MGREPGERVGEGFLKRVRALSRREHGFSLVETVVAMGTIFVSLTALAYTGTAGFRYIALARERQAANQIANQLMESTRGLAFATVQKGMLASEVSTADPHLVTGCLGDTAGDFRLESCSGGRIVATAQLPAVYPLVPHTGTFPRSRGYPIDYTWSTYVTNNDPGTQPYRVTVIVSWTGGGVEGAARSVQIQGVFWSPAGCVNSDTHPFAAPCQPFFFGRAGAEQGRIDISGPGPDQPVRGTTFASGSLALTGAESDVQVEQVAQVQGSFSVAGTTLTDASGTQSVGSDEPLATTADNDPATGAPGSSRAPAAGTYAFSGGIVATGDGSSVSVSAGNGAGESISTVAASFDCPTWLPSGGGQPCGSSRAQQAGEVRAAVVLNGYAAALGDTTIASVQGAADGQDSRAGGGFITSIGGNVLEQTVTRTIGRVDIGGLPAELPPELLPLEWDGYFLSLTGYSDSARADAGPEAEPPSAAIGEGAILRYWTADAQGGSYTTVPLNSDIVMPPASVQTIVDGHRVEVTMSGNAAAAGTVTQALPCDDPVTATCNAEASVTPPLLGTFTYQVSFDGQMVVNLAVAVNLGTVTANAIYQPPAAAGG